MSTASAWLRGEVHRLLSFGLAHLTAEELQTLVDVLGEARIRLAQSCLSDPRGRLE